MYITLLFSSFPFDSCTVKDNTERHPVLPAGGHVGLFTMLETSYLSYKNQL